MVWTALMMGWQLFRSVAGSLCAVHAAIFKVAGNNFQPLDNVIMNKKIEKNLSNLSGLFNHARKI